ncbi:MAG: hypothetical protein WDM96_14515 [Lacunisphaera sp.]
MNEFKDHELESIHGGLTLIETVVAGAAVYVITSLINNWGAFKAGLAGDPLPKSTAAN